VQLKIEYDKEHVCVIYYFTVLIKKNRPKLTDLYQKLILNLHYQNM